MTKLPAGRLARHAYLDTLGNLRGLVRIGGPWLLLAWALLLLARGGYGIFGAAANLAVTLGVAAIAVAWHRHILLGEPLTARMAPVDARVARYFMLTVLIAIALTALPMLLLFLLGGGAMMGASTPGEEAAPPSTLALALVPVTLLACLYAALRLQLVFPATAIGDARMSFKRSWALTGGNGWRLFAGFLLVTMPVAGAAIALALFLGWMAEVTGSVVLLALADLAAVANAWVQAPLIASFLSYAYLWFQQQQASPQLPVGA
jgi:hypothetical protein